MRSRLVVIVAISIVDADDAAVGLPFRGTQAGDEGWINSIVEMKVRIGDVVGIKVVLVVVARVGAAVELGLVRCKKAVRKFGSILVE